MKRLGLVRPPRGLVSDFAAGSWSRWASATEPQPSQAAPLRRMTVLVPEGCVEDIRQFAQELRVRHRAEPAETPLRWQALSPSAELMISPECSARCAVRDTRAPGADRFRWTVAVLGQLDPVAEGRTETRARGAFARRGGGSSLFRGLPSGGGSVRDG